MSGFLYELKRTLTSKTVIVLTVVIVGLSSLSAVTSAQGNSQSSSPSLSVLSYGYGANETYHLVFSLTNQFGLGVQGVNINVTSGNGKVFSQQTNTMGFANFTLQNITAAQLEDQNISLGNGNWIWVDYNFTVVSGLSSYTNLNYAQVFLNQTNVTNPYFFVTHSTVTNQYGAKENITNNITRFQLSGVSSQSQHDRYLVNIIYEGDIGQKAPPIDLYYLPYNNSMGQGGPNKIFEELGNLNETNMTFFGSYSDANLLTVNPSNLTSSNTSSYVFALFTPSGKEIVAQPITIFTPATTTQVNTQFFGTEMSIMGLFIPLMASVSAYVTFGKDRTSGILESTLVRPVSRRSIILSRYLSNTSAVFIAAVLSFLLSSLVFSFYLGQALPYDTILFGLFAMLVAIASFVALVYFSSSMLKSQGAVLSAAIGIFFALDLFWGNLLFPVIPFAIITEFLRAPQGSIAFARGYVLIFYFSPAAYSTIASFLVTGSTSIFISSPNVTLSQIGVNLKYFLVGGILWIVIPIVLALSAFLKKD